MIIPAASSSVGLAAIQIANSIGPIPIATTRTRAKAAVLDAAGAAHVVVTSEQDLPTEVSQATGGKGARLVFGPVGGPQIETLAKAMSHCGILLIYGALATAPAPFPVITAMQKALALHGYTLFAFIRDPERLARAAAFIEDGARVRELRADHREDVPARRDRSSTCLHGVERAVREARRHRPTLRSWP